MEKYSLETEKKLIELYMEDRDDNFLPIHQMSFESVLDYVRNYSGSDGLEENLGTILQKRREKLGKANHLLTKYLGIEDFIGQKRYKGIDLENELAIAELAGENSNNTLPGDEKVVLWPEDSYEILIAVVTQKTQNKDKIKTLGYEPETARGNIKI